MLRYRHWLILTVLFVTGCTQPVGVAAVDSTSVLSSSESLALCQADVAGTASVDKNLQRAQLATKQFPKLPEYWVAAGRGWVRKARLSSDPGFYVNVDGCVTEALRINTVFAPALELRSLVLMNNHQFELARALAEKILAKTPDSVIAQGTLSDALLEMGRYPEAGRAAQAQMSKHPGMSASVRAAHLNWLKGDIRSAQLFIRDALMERNAADPEAAAWAFVEAGMMYWHRGDYAGADAIFTEALNWVPNYPAALVGRGRVALATGQAATAIAQLSHAQRLHPLVETAWLLGDAYTLGGDSTRAKLAYEDAERQGLRGDRFTLALFLVSKNRRVDEALRLLDEERKTRGGIYVDDAYAWALYRVNRIEDARHASAQALRLGTQDARLLYHAGAINIAAGKLVLGQKQIRQALALNSGFDLTAAEEARKLLAQSPTKSTGS